MKISKLFLIALLAIPFIGCSNDDEGPATNEVRSVSVTLSGLSTNSSGSLRATGPTDVLTATTKDVNSVLINLTDANGIVIVSKAITKDALPNSDWDKLVTTGKGLKFVNTSRSVAKVYVYGNPGTAVNSSNVVATNIGDQQGSAVLYSGSTDNLTLVPEPLEPDPTNGQTYVASVTIVPVVARLQIKSVSFKNTGSFVYNRTVNNENKTATVTWDAFSADLKGIYMNNFYHKYNAPSPLTDLLVNLNFTGAIQNGQWLFASPGLDAAAFGSYSNFENGDYTNLPLSTANKCYAFNFFPSTEIPKIHLDLANIVATNLQSTNLDVFNPSLIDAARFANIVKYYKNSVEEMLPSDFKAGTLYNMDIEIIPSLDSDLKNMQYNVLVYVTIAPWGEETLTPGFDLSE